MLGGITGTTLEQARELLAQAGRWRIQEVDTVAAADVLPDNRVGSGVPGSANGAAHPLALPLGPEERTTRGAKGARPRRKQPV
jgi:hypothetical protein